MTDILNNPVFNALSSGDKHLGYGTEKVKMFDEEVSPFAGIEDNYKNGFSDLYNLQPPRKYILFATPFDVDRFEGWRLVEKVEGVQMVHHGAPGEKKQYNSLEPLNVEHVPQMLELAQLTKPGPFGRRTIEFGHYHGIFDNGKLVAMTGQRMHLPGYTEISAVCTHPDYLGKGFAFSLVHHQLALIYDQQKIPFLHVKKDNTRAIDVYQRLGFNIRSPMKFYFMARKNQR